LRLSGATICHVRSLAGDTVVTDCSTSEITDLNRTWVGGKQYELYLLHAESEFEQALAGVLIVQKGLASEVMSHTLLRAAGSRLFSVVAQPPANTNAAMSSPRAVK
jgi:hypothetical protein